VSTDAKSYKKLIFSTGSKKSSGRNSKRSSFSSRTQKITLKYSLGKIFVPIIIALLLICLGGLSRYFAVKNLTHEDIIACKLARYTIDIYIDIMTINVVVAELVLWDNTSQVYFESPLTYFYKVKDRIQSKWLREIDGIVAQNSDEIIDVFMEKYQTTLCDVFYTQLAVRYEECDTVMSGIANKPLSKFFKDYVRLLENLVQEWKMLPTLEARYSLLTRPEYEGIMAYATHDFFSTTDSFYYHLISAIFSNLAKNLQKIPAMMNLTNIIFTIWSIIVFTSTIPLIYIRMSTMQMDYWQLYQSIPIGLINSSGYAKDILKGRRKKSSFFD
jgi:hypothetical protein